MVAVEDLEAARQPAFGLREKRKIVLVLDSVMPVELAEKEP